MCKQLVTYLALLPHPLDCEVLEGTICVASPSVLSLLTQYLHTPNERLWW